MFTLGYIVSTVVILAVLALPVIILGLVAWRLWQKVQRARAQREESAYDAAYRRALESIAAINGRRAAERDMRALLEGAELDES